MEIKELNIYNKDILIKDFLIGKISQSVSDTFNLSKNDNDKLILKGGTALRKFFIPNYPRFTGDLDYKISDVGFLDVEFMKNLEKIIHIYMADSIQNRYKSINITPTLVTIKGTAQFGIRFNKVLGRFDYNIGMEFSPIGINENIETEIKQIIPSKIDEIIGYNVYKPIEVENINSSMGNKTFAILQRIGTSDKNGSMLSRFKDLFDIRYCYSNNLLDINNVKKNFWERFIRESIYDQKIVKNQIYQIIDSENYFQNLIKFLINFDKADDEKAMFYKYVRGLDKNYIIPNTKDIYDCFVNLLIYTNKS